MFVNFFRQSGGGLFERRVLTDISQHDLLPSILFCVGWKCVETSDVMLAWTLHTSVVTSQLYSWLTLVTGFLSIGFSGRICLEGKNRKAKFTGPIQSRNLFILLINIKTNVVQWGGSTLLSFLIYGSYS